MTRLDELQRTVVPFGKDKGKTFDECDLGYLDWMLSIAKEPLKSKLAEYLNHPTIAPLVEEALSKNRR